MQESNVALLADLNMMFRPATLGGYAVPWAYHVNKKEQYGNLNETNV
jgi:hypothetical protein